MALLLTLRMLPFQRKGQILGGVSRPQITWTNMSVSLHLPPITQPWSWAPLRAVLTFSTVLLSEDGVRPDHKANLQGSPSTCSVTPSSEVCRQEMPVRGGEGEGSGGKLRAGVGGERQQRGEGRGRGLCQSHLNKLDILFISPGRKDRQRVPD